MIVSVVKIVFLLATCTAGLTRGLTHKLLFITRHDISLVELTPPTDLLSRRRPTTTSSDAGTVDESVAAVSSQLTATPRGPSLAESKYNESSYDNPDGDQLPPLRNRVIVSGLDDASAVDFLWTDSSLYWTDATNGRLYQAFVNDTGRVPASGRALDAPRAIELGPGTVEVISVGLVSPDGVACDWVARKLYWVDSETDRIEVSELDGASRRVLYWRLVDQPRSIVLDPRHGHMFWADWGESPKLERSGMDGDETTRSVIVSGADIFWPNSLTIDHDVGRIYWTDVKLMSIQSVRLDGSDRRPLYVSSGTGSPLPSSSLRPTSMTLVDDVIYWSDWRTLAVYAADKHRDVDARESDDTSNGGGGGVSSSAASSYRIVATNIRVPMHIRAYGSQRQPQLANPCGVTNGGCSHLCLLSPTPPFYKCSCPTGVKLLDNNRTCADGPEEMLLLARRSDLRRISLDTLDFTTVVLNIHGVRHAVVVDYDPVDRMVYWTDDSVRAVRRARLDGTGAEFVVNVELDHSDGIAVDWISRNLYWTDKGTDRIEMSRLNGMGRRVIVSEGLEEPRAIVVDPFGGRIYWTDWGKLAKIDSAALDGTDRMVIVNTSLSWPNGLAIDRSESRLYWADASLDRIEMIFLNGTGRRLLVSENIPHVFGFALLGDYIYWTDWQRRTVERIHKLTGKQRAVIVDQMPDVMGLAAVNTSVSSGVNGCYGTNGGCSHLCIHRPGGLAPRCLCPKDMRLDADGKRCLTPEALLIYARQTEIRRISLGTETAADENDILVNSGVKEACAVDCHIAENRVYWTDTATKSISSVFINGSSLKRVVEFGLSQPEGVAIDWIAKNLYWTDFETERVEMSRLDGSSRLVLVSKDLRPRAIAVDPAAGYIYWSNAISSGTRLERADMDGRGRHTIVTEVGQVNSMTIDYIERRLYWVSVDRGSIEMSDMSGGSRRQLFSQLQQPYGVTVYGDQIYWSDWNTRTVEKAEKLLGAGRKVIKSRIDFPMDLSTFHVSRQQGWNACAANNGGCAHLCIADHQLADSVSSTSYHCACATHYTMTADNRTCQAPSSFLLISQRSEISRLSLNDVINTRMIDVDVTLPLRALRKIQAVAYDVNTNFIYWIDARAKSIRRSRDDGSQVSTVVSSTMRSDMNVDPYDIAVYSVAGGESELYWTDVSYNYIRAVKLGGGASGNGRVVLLEDQQKPRFIAIEPNEKLLIWTSVGRSHSIECSSLDGSSRRTLFNSGIKSLGPIAVDSTSRSIFWFDKEKHVIQSGSIDRSSGQQNVVIAEISNAVALAVAGSFVYWADGESKAVQRAIKTTGADRVNVRSRLDYLTDLIFVSRSQSTSVQGFLPCRRARCSHGCATEADGSSSCSCPSGMVLGPNRQTCVVDQSRKSTTPRCRDSEFSCVVGGKITCLTYRKRCDGEADCDDHTDELNCSATCNPPQFRCHSTDRCLEANRLCNEIWDCIDGSDEKSCSRCSDSSSFRCEVDGLCIARERVCDGRSDCRDSGDELNCPQNLSSYAPVGGSNPTMIIVGSSCGFVLVVICFVVYFSWRYGSRLACCRTASDKKLTGSSSWLTSSSSSSSARLRQKQSSLIMTQSLVAASRSNGSNESSELSARSQPLLYDRPIVSSSLSSVTGASASGPRYPRETLNPPPSPITTDCSVPSVLHRGRSAWRSRASATMSPCSTDVCGGGDDGGYSESSWIDTNGGIMISTTEFGYETDPLYPPPPTPCSRYVSTDIDATVCSRYLIASDDPTTCCCVSKATSVVSSIDNGCQGRRGCYKHSVTRAGSLTSMSS